MPVTQKGVEYPFVLFLYILTRIPTALQGSKEIASRSKKGMDIIPERHLQITLNPWKILVR